MPLMGSVDIPFTNSTQIAITAEQTANDAKTKAEQAKRKITQDDFPPENPNLYDLWMDTSVNPNVLKKWNGSSWITQTLDLVNLDPENANKWNDKIDKWFSMNQFLDRNIIPPGLPVGGIFTGAFIPNNSVLVKPTNPGEILIMPGNFIHPVTGSTYAIPIDTEIQTQFESSYVSGTVPSDQGFILFVGSDWSRFPNHVNSSGVASQMFIFAYRNASGQWYYDGNASYYPFTPTQNDAIIARVIGNNTGIVKILPYTVSRSGIYVDEYGMYAGTIRFDQAVGGEATLGGVNDVNGRLVVVNAAGDVVTELSASSGGFDNLYVGNLTSPSVLNVNRTSYTVNVTENVQQAIDDIADMNNATVTIKFMNDISENLNIKNFLGDGSIIIDLNGKKLNGYMDIQANAGQFINIINGTVNSDASVVIDIDRCSYVRLDNVKIFGKSGVTQRCLFVHAGSGAYATGCEFWNADVCVASGTGGQVGIDTVKGKGNQYGLHAFQGGIIVAYGNIPTGASANVMQVSGAVLGSYTQPASPTPPTPPPPPETTKTWESNDCGNWSTLYNSWEWGLVKQGNWGYGRRTGIWLFPNTIASTLSGKTIKSARCYVKRKSSGGYSSDVTIRIKYHAYQDRPSGQPDLDLSGSEEKTVSLAWGEGAWVTLPSSFHNNFANGTARGLGIYVASDSRSNYAIMEATCKLEVTYS